MSDDGVIYTAEVVNAGGEYTLEQLCEACAVPSAFVVELVEYGIMEPRGTAPREWRFAPAAVWRTRKAARLQRDLELNLAGISLALDLLDEIDALRQEVQRLERRLQALMP